MVFKLIVLSCLLVITHTDYLGVRRPLFSSRIIGGHDAKVGQFPHLVSLQWKDPKVAEFEHFCGGTILKDKWILTAGHCPLFVPGHGAIIAKAGKLNLKVNEPNEQTKQVKDIFIHKRYIGGVAPFDIALLKLKSPFIFNEYVHPINLPEADVEAVGTVILSGWGSTSKSHVPNYPNILQTAELSTIDLKTCNRSIESIEYPSPLHSTNMCTRSDNGKFSACSGDSGSPLITSDNENKEIVGITSWAVIPCGSFGAPSVYTRVSAFVIWIEETMRENS